MSEAIANLVRLAGSTGLRPDEGQWSKCYVYWFDALMPEGIRAAGHADPSVEYISSDGSPHNPSDEGFIDRSAGKAISFRLVAPEAR